MDDTPLRRQKSEFRVLTSMYNGEVKDLRKSKKDPLDLLINLKPQQGSISTRDVHVQLDFHVTCSSQYPDDVPKIDFTNIKGIPLSLLKDFRLELLQYAKEKIGSEVIWDLCQMVQEFLHKHNKPSSESFFVEMNRRKKEEQIQNEIARRQAEDLEAQKTREEFEELKEHARIEERKMSYSSQVDEQVSLNDSCNKKEVTSICSHEAAEYIIFDNPKREILRGKCLKHYDNGRSVYHGMDQITGEMFVVNEWIMDMSKIDKISFAKQLSSIEQEFKHILTLKHPGLILYRNYWFQSTDRQVIIRVLKDFVVGSNCFSLFVKTRINAEVDYRFIKNICASVLETLDYLHSKNVIHRGLKDSHVYILDRGHVQICNYSIHQRLTDLLNSSSQSSYGKKADVFRFGLFILGLLKGGTVTDGDDLTISKTFPADLQDFMNKCLSKEEKERSSVSHLLKHPFVTDKPNYSLSSRIVYEDDRQDTEMYDILQKESRPVSKKQSRINTDFEYVDTIGTGAYGQVKKYKQILSGQFYAIKQIKLNPSSKQLNKKILREVRLLSRLNHENVVRYNNSWIEISKENEDSSESDESSADEKKVIKTDILANDFQSGFEELSFSEDDECDKSSESDGIVFENPDGTPEISDKGAVPEETERPSSQNSNPKNPILYIQMEFCEKNTLRQAIDDYLYKDEPRMQRLFREILEGLSYIHQQGIIHRDLKPVNIFLDSKDHVKIGDFGLATTKFKDKMNDCALMNSAMESLRDGADESRTGYVGTPFYVAPELNVSQKVIYNEKVDIYSLGIILFEMCYKPCDTGMERCSVLLKVREKEIIFPDDSQSSLVVKNETLLRWLLDHDPTKRPTSQELLLSEYVPPPVLEEQKFMDLIRHTLSNPQSKDYKYLVASCFEQSFSLAQDMIYDSDLTNNYSKSIGVYCEQVKEVIVKIFQRHGAQHLATPLLMPNSKFYSFYEKDNNYVKLMNNSGNVVLLPYDLRVPFARYVAWNQISLFRRYSIERVYREKKIFGFIPQESYDCTFDIVTPNSGHFMSDAEVLFVVFEIMKQLPVLKTKNITIYLNHILLVKAIFIYCGVKVDVHNKLLSIFSTTKDWKSSGVDVISSLVHFELSEHQAKRLVFMLSSQCEPTKMSATFQQIIKRKECEKYLKTAMSELKMIVENAEAMGLMFDVFINPGLLYNAQQYSGMMCQFVCDFKKYKHDRKEILATGGRYDNMVTHYRNLQKNSSNWKDITQTAVGVTIPLDKIAQAIQKEDALDGNNIGQFDVIVTSLGNKRLLQEKIKIMSNLSSAGIRCTLLEANNIKEIEELREELKIPHIVQPKDNDKEKFILQTWDKEKRGMSKTFTIPELIEDIQKSVRTFSHQDIILHRSESKPQGNENVVQIIHTEKYTQSAKKRYESQIHSSLSEFFKRTTGPIAVITFNTDISVITTLANNLQFQTNDSFEKSISYVIEKHTSISKRTLRQFCDIIYEHRRKKPDCFIILYSVTDTAYSFVNFKN